MKLVSFALAVTLTGCAAPMHERSDYDVCRLTMRGLWVAEASQEARRRGTNCQALYPIIIQGEAANNAATMQLLQMMRPAPPAPASTMTCDSYRYGNRVETTCR